LMSQKSSNLTDLLGGITHNETPPAIWIRAPKAGPEPHTGLSKAMLYQLAHDGLIETRTVAQEGKERGVRLFWLASILRFLERCPDFVTAAREEVAR
jgi:hypothetical protein